MSSRSKQDGNIVIIVLAVVVLLAAGAGGYQYYKSTAQKAAVQKEAENQVRVAPEEPAAFEKAVKQAGTPGPTTVAEGKTAASIKADINTNTFQGVQLNTGQLIIGKLAETSAGKWVMTRTYELVTVAGTQTQISLQKSKTDPINIDATTVTRWTNYPTDHMYVKAITEYEKAQ
jgi:hypothetical protein